MEFRNSTSRENSSAVHDVDHIFHCGSHAFKFLGQLGLATMAGAECLDWLGTHLTRADPAALFREGLSGIGLCHIFVIAYLTYDAGHRIHKTLRHGLAFTNFLVQEGPAIFHAMMMIEQWVVAMIMLTSV